jgi:hypothetical protein
MATTTIWSGLSTVGLARIKVAEGHWVEHQPDAHLYVSIARDQQPTETPARIPCLSRMELAARLQQARRAGRIVMTVDTFLMLTLELQVISDSDVTTVFPWPADEPCAVVPTHNPHTDMICRNVARYYHAMFHHPVIDHIGNLNRFFYKACNTISYRAFAPYQNIKREERQKIKPVGKDDVVIQFDWSAAEFNLILQDNGYTPPEDAYGDFIAAGLDRDLTKKIVLAYIYGAKDSTLYDHAGGNALAVDQILKHLNAIYPMVSQWRDQCTNFRWATFNGFDYDLGDVPYRRPNHWAQTALQLCKWDLMSRIVQMGVHRYAAGDLHDQLMFHASRSDPASRANMHAVMTEILRPCFGRYNLRPKVNPNGAHWQ